LLERKIDNTKCILLHPDREGNWCPEGQDQTKPKLPQVHRSSA
jgi:hypothetical protein